MENRVVLILVDGMRPDGLLQCGHPFVEKLLAASTSTMEAVTVMPSVTLPCHMSLFHSVEPTRHGILTNTYVPQVRPIQGLCEQLHAAGKTCSFFYNWGELRDLTRPHSLAFSYFASGYDYTYPVTNRMITDAAVRYTAEGGSDFLFLYLGYPDAAGHHSGWMGEEYLQAVYESVESIRQLMESVPDGTTTIITADHGGHDRIHGTDSPEDMTIPLILAGPQWDKGAAIRRASILDIAPTITALLQVESPADWEGSSLL